MKKKRRKKKRKKKSKSKPNFKRVKFRCELCSAAVDIKAPVIAAMPLRHVSEYMDIRELIRKLLGKRDKPEMPLAPWEVSKICINCLESIPIDNIECNKCAHNQSLPVQKRIGSMNDISKAIVSGVAGQQNIDIEFLSSFSKLEGKPIKSENLNRAYIEILITKLAISYILFLESYRDHYNYKKFIDAFENEIDNIFKELFKDSDKVWKYFNYMLNQYLDAFKNEYPVESISNILKFILERTIAGKEIPIDFFAYKFAPTKPLKVISKEDVFPSRYHYNHCEKFIWSYIEVFTLWKNRWKIE